MTMTMTSMTAKQTTMTTAATKSPKVGQVRALVGQRLVIPCANLSLNLAEQVAIGQRRLGVSRSRQPANVGQGISLLVWHKNDQLDSPIFSVDAKEVASLREAKQRTNSEQLKGRAHLEESGRADSRGANAAPALVIEEASKDDEGLYTCTVEFHQAATQTHKIQVSLIGKFCH